MYIYIDHGVWGSTSTATDFTKELVKSAQSAMLLQKLSIHKTVSLTWDDAQLASLLFVRNIQLLLVDTGLPWGEIEDGSIRLVGPRNIR